MNDGLPYYDAVVRDLFQKDHPSLLDQLTGGVRIKAFLNIDLAKVLERRADLVLLLEDKTVLHIEFQSANDKDMAYRAGIYCVLLGHKYRCRVRQVFCISVRRRCGWRWVSIGRAIWRSLCWRAADRIVWRRLSDAQTNWALLSGRERGTDGAALRVAHVNGKAHNGVEVYGRND
jgi:hypothetical protein